MCRGVCLRNQHRTIITVPSSVSLKVASAGLFGHHRLRLRRAVSHFGSPGKGNELCCTAMGTHQKPEETSVETVRSESDTDGRTLEVCNRLV